MGKLESILEFKECTKPMLIQEKKYLIPDATTNDFVFWDC
jgi:hypothetical protein